MRRVFPLRSSQNSSVLSSENVEERHSGDDFKRRDQDEGLESTSVSMIGKRSESMSGDENFSHSYNDEDELATAKPPVARKPPRASAYPVFTAGRLTSASRPPYSSCKAQDKLASEKQLFAANKSSSASLDRKGVDASKWHGYQERPRSAPKNRPLVGASSSMRYEHLPDSVALRDDKLCHADPHCCRSATPQSLSQVVERSSFESSDSSSCFTRATGSSSSRSFTSESPSSKRSSVSERPVNSSSPFRYLSARMVAEKLARVLGKEKGQPQQSNSNPLASRGLFKHDLQDGSSAEDPSLEGKDTAVLRKPQSSAATFSQTFETPALLQTFSEHFDPSAGTRSLVHANQRASCRASKGAFFECELDSGVFQRLESRACAREELAQMLDRENDSWEGTMGTGSCSSTVETSPEFSAMRQEIRTLQKEKKELALEVAAEIRARIYEQRAAMNVLRCTKAEVECQVSRIEKEKACLQESMERELESRSEEWTIKLDKIRIEERCLRERVIEMASSRAELQKVVASFKVQEASWRAQAKDYEYSLCTLRQRTQASEVEAAELKQSSFETVSQLKVVERKLDTSAQRNTDLESENLELQKEIMRLRRVCNDQESTVEGLCQELDEGVNGTSDYRNESMLRLQRELLRLAGMEQTLRNEVGALHAERTSLKQRSNLTHDGALLDLVKVNHELQARTDGLQVQAATLLEENRQLAINLRTALRERRDAERALKLFQLTRDWAARLNRNLKSFEKGNDKEVGETDGSWEDGNLLLKLLRDKLLSREAEIEQLGRELAALLSDKNSLQIEVDDLHGKLAMANQRIREMERQIEQKEEEIEGLQTELLEQGKELVQLQSELPGARKQRDELRKESEDMSKEALRLTFELTELRKVAEKLEEEVLLKEGQISILRGAYGAGECVN